MRYIAFLITVFLTGAAFAEDWEEQTLFEGTSGGPVLRVLSSTDTSVFAQIIQEFIRENSGLSVEYLVTGSADLNRRFQADPAAYDVVISSAMDLQLKLANDGYAREVPGIEHPEWAEWRQSLFAFTLEPAVILISKAAFADLPVPGSRQELIEVLRAHPDRFRGRIGTYDIRESGLGYLFATQDARTSETFWRLAEVMGHLKARLYCCSGGMIDDLASGELSIAYNVLGSYSAARSDIADKIEIILPTDFATTMMRTVFVSAETTRADAAVTFLEFVITSGSTSGGDSGSPLPSVNAVPGGGRPEAIELGPALLVYLDQLKRRKFLAEWQNAIIQD